MTGRHHIIVRLLFCLGVVMPSLLGSACAAPAAPLATVTRTASADVTARDFYRWYIGLMARDKEPEDDPQTYQRYVTTALRAQIKRQIDSPDGMEVDYFIKAQDYLDDWIGHISVVPGAVRATTARSIVTLGVGQAAHRLAITMIREKGLWKVAGVKQV